LLGAAISLAKQHVQGAAVSGEGLADIPATLLLLPAGLVSPRPTPNFTFDPPIWSLFFEFAASALFATRLRRMTGWKTVVFLSTFAAADAIVTAVRVTGPWIEDGGLLSLAMCVPRTGFAFTFGAVVFRTRIWVKAPKLPIFFIGLALGVLLLMPGENGSAYSVAVLFVAFPAILVTGAVAAPVGTVRRACQWFGNLSYPLYILHYPVARAVVYVVKSRVANVIVLDGLALIAAVLFSSAVLKLYDEPVRRRLQHWRPRHSASMGIVAAQRP
jgi:peptidoglycan/LPS O-acetylase OafA/YrhL